MDTPTNLTSGQVLEVRPFSIVEEALKVEPKEFTEFELDDALYDIDDLMARCQMFYCVLKNTAKAMVDEVPLYGDGIDIGIRRTEYRSEVLSTIKTYQPDAVFTEDGFSYVFNGVPVRAKLLPSKSPLYEAFDFRWHKTWQYNIPNPWSQYEATL